MARKSLQHPKIRQPRRLPEFDNPEQSRKFMEVANALGIDKEYFDEADGLPPAVTKAKGS